MKAQCKQCGSIVDFAEVKAEVINVPNMSVVVIPHERPGFCLGCKSKVSVMIASINLNLMAAPVAEQKKSPIVIVPGGALPGGGRK